MSCASLQRATRSIAPGDASAALSSRLSSACRSVGSDTTRGRGRAPGAIERDRRLRPQQLELHRDGVDEVRDVLLFGLARGGIAQPAQDVLACIQLRQHHVEFGARRCIGVGAQFAGDDRDGVQRRRQLVCRAGRERRETDDLLAAQVFFRASVSACARARSAAAIVVPKYAIEYRCNDERQPHAEDVRRERRRGTANAGRSRSQRLHSRAAQRA